MTIQTFEQLDQLSTEELYILRVKVDSTIRERRIRNAFMHQKDNKNPQIQVLFLMLERELNKQFPATFMIDEYLDVLEGYLKISIDD